MKIHFSDRNLQKLYETGKIRKPRLSTKIIKKFVMRIGQIEAAETIYDFWETPSLHFEKLQGRANGFSMRLDIKWRLEFSIQWEDEEQTKGEVFIEKISKHYQ